MDKTNDIRYINHEVRGLLHEIDELAYKATTPESDEGIFISDKEREEIEEKIKVLIKRVMDLLNEAKVLPRTSPCCFCVHSKQLKEK